MRLYAVTATAAVKIKDGATLIRQIPTFYLDANVQGFMDEADSTSCTIYVTAVAL